MKNKVPISRRQALKGIGVLGASAIAASGGCGGEVKTSKNQVAGHQREDIRRQIYAKVQQTPFIDTHEHLIEEYRRLDGSEPKGDDWTMVLSHYFDSDMLTAGMSHADYDRFFSKTMDPIQKWQILKPFWPAVKNTGYGQAVRITFRKLYGVDELSDETVGKIQQGYEKTRKKGFYNYILRDVCNIESCQVNCLDAPFAKSATPTLLMQDLSIVGMYAGLDIKGFSEKAGIETKTLADWYRVIDWWFAEYGNYAVAVKSQDAYGRDIDYEKVPAEKAEPIFEKVIEKDTLTPEEKKSLSDHLFWYVVGKANDYHLPVKLHTGYYVGENNMPLSRLLHNPASACDLCRVSPETRFVFMHIGYPFYEPMIALAKHYTNAYLDMCWSWIINPVAAKDFLKKYLVTAPANKIFSFGGDYGPVEPVVGHAQMARNGIALALSELVEEKWCGLDDALELVNMIMHDNAEHVFNLAEKRKLLTRAPWTA